MESEDDTAEEGHGKCLPIDNLIVPLAADIRVILRSMSNSGQKQGNRPVCQEEHQQGIRKVNRDIEQPEIRGTEGSDGDVDQECQVSDLSESQQAMDIVDLNRPVGYDIIQGP